VGAKGREKAEIKRQKLEGVRQKAGKRQKAKGRSLEGRRQKVNGRCIYLYLER
jgi:hypothetical protein